MTERIAISRRKHLGITFALLVGALTVFVGASVRSAYAVSDSSASDEHIITLHDDGVEKGFITKASTLREALAAARVRLDANDRTEPGLDETLVARSYEVNIYRARPVIVRDGSNEIRVMTSYRTAKQIAEQAGLRLHDEDRVTLGRSTNIMRDGVSEVLTIDYATPFTFVFYGKTIQSYTREKTVAAMLKQKKIVPAADDTVMPATTAAMQPNMVVQLWKNGEQTVTLEEDIAYPVQQIRDANRDRGYKEVKTTGTNGKKSVTYTITMQNGKEVSRRVVNSVTTKEPVGQVEVIGVKGMYTTPSENESITWAFLIGKGLSREQTAGIMGNLMQEHGFNTSGDGLAQWTGSRQTRLRTMFPDTYMTIQAQLDYLWYELSGPYAGVLANIRAQTTVEGSVVVFQNQYERCGVCVEGRRIQFAYNILASH